MQTPRRLGNDGCRDPISCKKWENVRRGAHTRSREPRSRRKNEGFVRGEAAATPAWCLRCGEEDDSTVRDTDGEPGRQEEDVHDDDVGGVSSWEGEPGEVGDGDNGV